MSKDDIEIQAAIDYMAGQGGGLVQLTEGTFYIDTAIVLKNNITLQGRGASTIIQQETSTANIIEAIGTAGSFTHDLIIRDISMQRPTSSVLSTVKHCIYLQYVYNANIEKCYGTYSTGSYVTIDKSNDCKVLNNIFSMGAYSDYGISIKESKSIMVDGNNLISVGGGIYAYILTGDVILNNNIIDGVNSSTGHGIYILSASRSYTTNNHIYNIAYRGLSLNASSDCTVSNNSITSSGSHGIYTYLSGKNIINCNIVKWCASTGIYINNGEKNIVTSNVSVSNGTNFFDYGTSTTTGNNIFA